MTADGTAGRVLLIGKGGTTSSALRGLVDEFEVCALVRSTEDETTALAAQRGVPVITDSSVDSVRETIARTDPDAVVVSSYDRILGADLIGDRPFVNVHYAPLPRGRGRATVNWALINGDDEVAITIHHLVPELDAGAILYQESVPIGPDDTVADLYDRLNELQRSQLAAATAAAIAGEPGRAQDESGATYYCTRLPDDGEIDWSRSTAEIHRLVRALQPPFPPAFTFLGLDRIAVEAARPVQRAPSYEGRIPGRVVRVDRRGGTVDVLTGDGVLRVERIRVDDGEPVDAAELIRTVTATLGLRAVDVVRALRGQR